MEGITYISTKLEAEICICFLVGFAIIPDQGKIFLIHSLYTNAFELLGMPNPGVCYPLMLYKHQSTRTLVK